MEETRLVGELPTMRVEITHSQEPDGNGERMTIALVARPGIEAALPMLMQLPPALAAGNPMMAWMSAMQAMMGQALAPWQALARANPFLSLLPGAGSGTGEK